MHKGLTVFLHTPLFTRTQLMHYDLPYRPGLKILESSWMFPLPLISHWISSFLLPDCFSAVSSLLLFHCHRLVPVRKVTLLLKACFADRSASLTWTFVRNWECSDSLSTGKNPNLHFKKPTRWFVCTLKFWDHWARLPGAAIECAPTVQFCQHSSTPFFMTDQSDSVTLLLKMFPYFSIICRIKS